MNKRFFGGIILLILITSFRLFFGVYVDDEFGDESLFIKHRPIWKWKFYSPIGMSDLRMKDLTKEKQIEEKYYDEFIRKN
jgi:hypothetical protein